MIKTRIWAAVALSVLSGLCAAQETPINDAMPSEETSADSMIAFHLAGYADIAYAASELSDGSVALGTLAPILHLQIGERFLVETEFELEVDSKGEREQAVEYATVNYLINDNLALVAGKFLSPVGYYFQNLHPSWINKMSSAPVGFGHGGAAPLSDFGVQLRGGKTFANGQHLNYAVYAANGPKLMLEGVDDPDIDADGSSVNPDGERVTGGRLGWMPSPKIELGVSAVRGDVALIDVDTVNDEPSRGYRVDGFDFAWRPTTSIDLRAEWIRQQIAAADTSLISDRAVWRAWYMQAGYRFGSGKWEAVARYGDSSTPHSESTVKQRALGINYLIRSNAMLKLTYESNDSINEETDADRLILQLAYAL